ncbi:uncharacterized protein LOC125945046 [Dermacentor silvarum]|uniref:uncharacterized protein LOC125945046 n=1 Tax=Dermacentor silvarum TaxID=543639 RepID=UPI002100FD31|nr:uncharacterized protein LOC125945046 [Dermacentor silvarum]
MAAADTGAQSRRMSMVPTGGAEQRPMAAVPVGSAPVIPAYVPPAQVYEDDEDEVEEVMKPQRQIVQAGAASGPSALCILCTAMVLLTVAAAGTFYALNMAKTFTEGTTASTTTKAPTPHLVFNQNVTVEQRAGPDVTEEGHDAATDAEVEASYTHSA